MTSPPDMTRSPRRCATPMARAVLAALTLVLAGCASPPSRFYTLTDDTGTPAGSAATSGANVPAARYAVEVSPVAVPEQVDRPQIVVTRRGGRVDILEESRWAAPLKTELTSTISRKLTQHLGAMDVYGLPRADGLTVYRVSTSVQRFESVPGEQAALAAVWSVRRVPGDVVLTCRFAGTETASGSTGGIDDVVAAQRRLVDRLALGIGNAIATSAQGATPHCER
ncbi:lipoprotein [Pandoraea sp. NE5]|uniref:PqiC family protein n=1 Tax=Pandoraea sp. NE5 TaxID=2904129 RepID=UPI0021C48402|nr:PqiC family protein [Pandoraea sp. NE5]BDD95029.1 lipoprotein [Pandoraea sp. NE5]